MCKGLLTLLGVLFFLGAIAQDDMKIIPPPPTAAELGHFGLANAKLSDGSFGTQIPLYEYKTQHLSLPITLVYSTNGLKVDKVASRVGMDWMLMVGGSIGKMVLGLDDDTHSIAALPSDFPMTKGDSLAYTLNLINNHAVDVPDIYNFSFNGNNGRFLIVKNQIIKLEQNSLQISRVAQGFLIVDNSGIQYLFTKQETSESYSTCSHGVSSSAVTNWLLTQISHPLGDVITLQYKACDFSYSTGVSQAYTKTPFLQEGNCDRPCTPYPGDWDVNCVGNLRVRGYMIDRVYSNARGTVEFGYIPRSDIAGDSALASIKIFDGLTDRFGNTTYYDQLPLKTIAFNYNVINAVASGYPGAGGLATSQRLFLDHIVIGKTALSDDAQAYFFEYNQLDNLPPRLSYSQDHFGFFNGRNNQSLIPKPVDLQAISDFSAYGFGDRNPNGQYAVHGTLSKIIYPTKGYDSIVYEPNGMFTEGRNCNNPDTSIEVFVQGNSTFKHVDKYYSAPFTVHCPQVVTMSIGDIPTETGYPNSTYLVYAIIQGPNGNIYVDIAGRSLQATPGNDGVYNVSLNPGTYTVTLVVQGPSRGVLNFSFNDAKANGELEMPGLRVKRILTFPDKDAQPLVKRYLYVEPTTGHSSGSPYVPDPVYQSIVTVTKLCDPVFNGLPLPIGYMPVTCSYFTYTSDNFYSLYTYSGNNIYYSSVSELSGENGENGKVDHAFLIGKDVNATVVTGSVYKGAPLSNYGIYNGFELNIRYYKRDGADFKLIKEVLNTIKDDPRLSKDYTFYGFQTDAGFSIAASLPYNNLYGIPGLHAIKYNMISRWLYPDSTTTIEYNDNGTVNKQVIHSVFDNTDHMQLTQQWMRNSKGEKITTKFFYPLDDVTPQSPEAVQAKQDLVSLHMYNALLKKQSYNEEVLLTEEQNDYNSGFVSTIPLLNKKYKSFLRNNKVLDAEVSSYDAVGNIAELKNKGICSTAFIWDYQSLYPIAQVSNAGVNSVAYTSFEADGKGNWSFDGIAQEDASAITGKKSYALSSGSLSKSNLPQDNYVVSFWMKGGAATVNGVPANPLLTRNGWTFYKTEFTGTSSIVAGSGNIDEIRLYPKKAQMTTFTYDPLIGLSSQTDPAGRVTYYMYDDEMRLHAIKDQDGNILKTFDYNYRNY